MQDRALHGGTGHKAGGRDLEHDLRVRIILDRQGEGPVFLAAGTGADPVGDLLLHHDSDTLKASLLLEQVEQDRGRHIIGEVRDHFERPALVVFLRKLLQVRPQDVLPDHIHIVIARQGLVQDRAQVRVDLHADDMPRRLGEVLGHGPDSRADLQDTVVLRDAGRIDDPCHDPSVGQEVLAVFFAGVDPELCQNGACHARGCEFGCLPGHPAK